jgi:hypothetical protein
MDLCMRREENVIVVTIPSERHRASSIQFTWLELNIICKKVSKKIKPSKATSEKHFYYTNVRTQY